MSTQDAPTHYDDVIDSRDVIARIEELEAALEGDDAAEDPDPADVRELAVLRALAEEGADYATDWEYGAQLIRDSYFVTYAEELADDIGAVKRDAPWPCNFIDWDAAADALKEDYTEVNFDGVAYWVR